MNLKEILIIISVGFLLQGMFFAIFRSDKIIDREKIDNNPKEALRVKSIIFGVNLLFWGIVIFLIRLLH